MSPKSALIGFLGGPKGVMTNNHMVLTEEYLAEYRNTGGFDAIGSGRDKIKTEAQKFASLQTCNDLNLDGLIIIGGDDSNTNAAVLAEFFAKSKSNCVVCGVPKTIDGDLQNEYIEISFGFDTATRTYGEMV